MQLPITQERTTLDRLLATSNWRSLEHFGIRVLQPVSEHDCGHYVLLEFELLRTPELIEALEQLPTTPQQRDGIIVYKSIGDHGSRTMHYGFISGDRVRSKWGRTSPVLEHSIGLVPASYGTYLEFCSMKTAREHFVGRQQKTLFGPEYY